MSNTPRYNNGDLVISECYFCGEQFEEQQKLGDTIHCDPNSGGCDNIYRITIGSRIAKKEGD